MNLIWILLALSLLALAARAARGAWRLWRALPDRNADFGWTRAEMWGRP